MKPWWIIRNLITQTVLKMEDTDPLYELLCDAGTVIDNKVKAKVGHD